MKFFIIRGYEKLGPFNGIKLDETQNHFHIRYLVERKKTGRPIAGDETRQVIKDEWRLRNTVEEIADKTEKSFLWTILEEISPYLKPRKKETNN